MNKVLYYREVKVWGLEQVGVDIKVGNDLQVIDYYELYAQVEVIGNGDYYEIYELIRELISVNLNVSYCVLQSDGNSELDRLFVPYRVT